MARIDAFIDRLFSENGFELAFEAGSGAVVRCATGEIPLLKQPLTAAQIIGAVTEVLPDEIRPGFPPEGNTSFPYRANAGMVSMEFERRGGQVRLLIVPAPPGSVTAMAVPEVKAAPAVRPPLQASRTGNQTPAAGRPAPAPAASPAVPTPRPAAPPSRSTPRVSAADAQEVRQGDGREAMEKLLALMVEGGASDLHLSSDNTPMVRVDGGIRALGDFGPMSSERLKELFFAIAPAKNQEEFTSISDTDFAYETEKARFRVNLFSDRNGVGAVLRQIPHKILTVEDLGLAQAVLDLCHLHKGLVVVTGPTGSGKSTTLAAMVDYVNRTREDHIITIEDPIEFVHPNKRCLVNQREIGVNTSSFKHALRAALREDPDIVLVGEMRDLETVSIAIETAETGHLVFGTLHTNTAASTVDRIIDQFPTDRQSQIRLMLAESLKGVIAQTLCKRIGGGRAAALEVLIATGAVSNLIREGKTFQIPSIMQTGRGVGMVTLNDALLDLVKKKIVDPAEAYAKSIAKAEFRPILERAGFSVPAPAEAPAAAARAV